MTLIEVFVPKGSLSETERRTLGERLVTGLLSGRSELVERARAMTSVLIHEPQGWSVGGRGVASTVAPPFFVRLIVPGGHLNDGQRDEAVSRITRVLSEFAGDTQRLYRNPDAWIQIVEAPDGSLGLFGQVIGNADLIQRIVDPTHDGALHDRADASQADRQRT